MIVALKKKVHTKCRSVWKYASQEKCNNECSMCITVEFFCVGGGMGGTGPTGSAPEVVALCEWGGGGVAIESVKPEE